MINPEKYLVEENDKGIGGGFVPPEDFFVLRKGDILATATLLSYVSNVLTLLDLDKMGVASLTDEQRAYLTELADYTADLANDWVEHDPKLPD